MNEVLYVKFNKLKSGSEIVRNSMIIQHFFELLACTAFLHCGDVPAPSLKNQIKNMLRKQRIIHHNLN